MEAPVNRKLGGEKKVSQRQFEKSAVAIEAATKLIWNAGDRNGTSLHDFLDVENVDAAIAKLEAAAGAKGDWEMGEYGWDWWGLTGTFEGKTFTVYTHKTGRLKIGAHAHSGLDVVAVRKLLEAVVA